MDPIEVVESGAPRQIPDVRFVDISGLGNESDSWTPVFLVYSGLGRAGVIEFEQATRYYKFTPINWGPGAPVLGNFSIDALKRQVSQWLETGTDE